jgi:hypothetical protein
MAVFRFHPAQAVLGGSWNRPRDKLEGPEQPAFDGTWRPPREDILTRVWENLVARAHGPMKFRVDRKSDVPHCYFLPFSPAGRMGCRGGRCGFT